MTRFYVAAAFAALAFFSYAQYQGMSLFGSRGAQNLTSSGGGSGIGRSSTLSHK